MMSRLELRQHIGSGSESTSGSESGSTCDEERLREIFISCDPDGDGFIDSHDLIKMCEKMNVRHAYNDLHRQLGLERHGRISLQQFLSCQHYIMGEMEAVRLGEVNYVPRNVAWRISGTGSESTNPDHIYETIPETIEIPTMTSLLDKFHNDVYNQIKKDRRMLMFMEVIDQIHTKCLSSMKTDYMELTSRLHQIRTERDLLEKQLNKLQSDHVTAQTIHQQRLDEMSCRYEERITELHSVIAELQKKIERSKNQFNIIREEDEDVVEEDMSNRSEFSNTDNLAHSLSLDDEPVMTGLNRVVLELESSEPESDLPKDSPKSRAAVGSPGNVIDSPKSPRVDRVLPPRASSLESPVLDDRSPVGRQGDVLRRPSADSGRPLESPSTPPPVPPPRSVVLKPQQPSQEQRLKDLSRENEHLKAYVHDLERRLAMDELVQPLTQEQQLIKNNEGDSGNKSDADAHSQFTVAKVAGLKKLKTQQSPKKLTREVHSMNLDLIAPGNTCPVAVSGAVHRQPTEREDGQGVKNFFAPCPQLPSSKLAEHLSASVQDCSHIQEVIHGIESGDQVEDKIRGFQVEMERLTSQIDHLKAQNDVLIGTLDESKNYSDRLSFLFSKHESNLVAHQLANEYADNLIEWYDVLCGLYETRLQLQQTVGELDPVDPDTESENVFNLRHSYVTRARALLALDVTSSRDQDKTLDHANQGAGCAVRRELDEQDQQKLREHIQKLKTSRCQISASCLDLSAVYLDPPLLPPAEAQRLDLENAVIMQEMMALKEEKSELKSQNYLLVREKKALELRLNNRELQEQSYQVQICHLKCEIKELSKTIKELRYRHKSVDKESDGSAAGSPYHRPDVTNQPPSQLVSDLIETQRREEKLRRRVYDLVTALEKLSRDSEVRHNQSADFVNDLKKANSSLISSFERAKKKYQSKVKKLDQQLSQQKEYYEAKLQERSAKSPTSPSSDDPSATQRRVNETTL